MEKTSNAEIKRRNRQNILRFIFGARTTSRLEIAAALDLSMPTVLQNVKELEELGLVAEAGQFDSTGGRKAARLTSVPEYRLAAGLDITRNHVALVLSDLSGNLLSHRRVACPFSDTAEYYRGLAALLEDYFGETPNAKERLLGVGISVPGILNADGTILTDSHALSLSNLSCAVIGQSIPYPCHFLNDANAAGLAELRRMPAESTLVYLSLSNSVGGAFFLNGKLYAGENERAGEFGHMRLIPGGRECYCGQRGCLDAYCSALRLAEGGRLEDFFAALAAGDPGCVARWEEYKTHLALAVTNLRMGLDCTVMLGGYVGGHLEPFLPQLQEAVRKLDTFGSPERYLQACRYRHEASAYGGAMLLVAGYLDSI